MFFAFLAVHWRMKIGGLGWSDKPKMVLVAGQVLSKIHTVFYQGF
jgi:hypothetical protein